MKELIRKVCEGAGRPEVAKVRYEDGGQWYSNPAKIEELLTDPMTPELTVAFKDGNFELLSYLQGETVLVGGKEVRVREMARNRPGRALNEAVDRLEYSEIWKWGNKISGGHGFWGSLELFDAENPKDIVRAWTDGLRELGYSDIDVILYGDWKAGRMLADYLHDDPGMGYDKFKALVKKEADRDMESVRAENEKKFARHVRAISNYMGLEAYGQKRGGQEDGGRGPVGEAAGDGVWLAITDTHYTCYAIGKTPEEAKRKAIAYAKKRYGYESEYLDPDSINTYQFVNGVTSEGD